MQEDNKKKTVPEILSRKEMIDSAADIRKKSHKAKKDTRKIVFLQYEVRRYQVFSVTGLPNPEIGGTVRRD